MGDLEENLETLFLLEVLVDNVQFDKPPKDEDLRETCVGFQFLKYPPLIICEEDFVYMADDEFEKQNVQFKSGKSILFALPSLQEDNPKLGKTTSVVQSIITGSIHVWVTRRIGRSDKTKVMGATNINLTGSFENLLLASAKQMITSPVSKFIRDVYPFSQDGKPVGTITAFLRVSCFGKLLVTQFEVKGKEKFNFKGLEHQEKTDTQDGVRFRPGTKDGQQASGMSGPGGVGQTDSLVYPEMGAGMYPGMGPGMYPGMGPGIYPGMGVPGMGPGMYPGMGSPGMGPGMYPGMGGPGTGGSAMYPGIGMYGQGPFGNPGMDVQAKSPCPGPKPWFYGKKGVLPCGGKVCPAGNCNHFPCAQGIPGGSTPCTQMMGFMCNPGACQQLPTCMTACPGPAMMAMGTGMDPRMGMTFGASPAHMNVQVTEEDIVATMKMGQMPTVPQNMAWASKRIHLKRGTLPCGEPKCPICVCGGFPCQHAPPCGNLDCTVRLLAMGFPPEGDLRPIRKNICPTDRSTNVTEEDIPATLPKVSLGTKKAAGKMGKAGGKKGKK